MGKTKNIEPIIDWIVDMEDKAARCYEKAVELFSGNKELVRLLGHLAEDEKYHSKIVHEAAECLRDEKAYPALVFSFDNLLMQEFERPFVEFEKDLDGKGLTKKDLFNHMVFIEFKEWNDIFLYIIDSFKDCCDFSQTGPLLQRHRRDMVRFIESDPELSEFLERVKMLPQLWRDKILLVNDSQTTVAMLKAVLQDEGLVVGAKDGNDALEKLSREDFSVIIADGDMPVMDGVEFYKSAEEIYPNLKGRILFYSAYGIADHFAFFRERDVRYLIMPVLIKDLRKEVVEILDRPAA
jgi:CheY-like chemotaxis protein